MENKVRHPGIVVWDEYFSSDPKRIAVLFRAFTGDFVNKVLDFLTGDTLLSDSDIHTMCYDQTLDPKKVIRLQEDYREYLNPKPTDDELIAKKLSEITGLDKNDCISMVMYTSTISFTLIAETLLNRILGMSLKDWVEKEREALQKKREPVQCFMSQHRFL